jgi:hypothetical protein
LAGVTEDPSPDLADLAGLFKDRDKRIGLQQASGGVLPPQQCLDANDAKVVEVIDRLVNEPELFACQGRPKLEFEFDPMLNAGLHIGVKHGIAVFTGSFGFIEGNVGVSEQVPRAQPIANGDTDAGIDDQWHPCPR